jgi:hypothetical protein
MFVSTFLVAHPRAGSQPYPQPFDLKGFSGTKSLLVLLVKYVRKEFYNMVLVENTWPTTKSSFIAVTVAVS